jgi:hypothetical protein
VVQSHGQQLKSNLSKIMVRSQSNFGWSEVDSSPTRGQIFLEIELFLSKMKLTINNRKVEPLWTSVRPRKHRLNHGQTASQTSVKPFQKPKSQTFFILHQLMHSPVTLGSFACTVSLHCNLVSSGVDLTLSWLVCPVQACQPDAETNTQRKCAELSFWILL